MDADKIHKKHKGGNSHQEEEPAPGMQMDVGLDVEPLQEIIYPRYNGPDAPYPDAHMGIFSEEVEEEEEQEVTPRRNPISEFNLSSVDPVSGGVVSTEFEEPEEGKIYMWAIRSMINRCILRSRKNGNYKT